MSNSLLNSFDPRQDQVELIATVWGRVQGVGFRVTTRHYALELGLKGTVRNSEDGNVEIVAQGPREKIEEFVRRLQKHFGPGYIARFDLKYQKLTSIHHQFNII